MSPSLRGSGLKYKVLVYPEKAVIILNMTDEMADPPKREQVEAFMSNVGEVSL